MHKLGYILLNALMTVLGKLPLSFHHGAGRFVAWLADGVFRYRRDVVTTNLSRSFPELKYKELAAVRKDFYRHFGDVFGEAVWFGGCTDPKRLRESGIAVMTNPEELNRAYDNAPSVMVLSSHSGNWELSGGYVNYALKEPLHCPENDVCVVYRRLHSQAWDLLMQKNRRAPIVDKEHYEGMIESSDVMRYVVRHRDEKKVYNFITDQFPYAKSSRIDVGEFMHQQTLSMDGGAKLACKFGMAVLYMGMVPVSRGHYEITYTTICDDASRSDAASIMREYYNLLQKDIERAPYNYLWSHKRWK